MGGARQEGGTPFPHPRAADCFRSPSTSYHVWTNIGNINVPTSLDGGGLYALRAGRCGCDSLSLAGSRQRVKSLRSSVRLRLGHILLARSSPELTPASPPSNLPRARSNARQRPADTQSVPDFGLVVVHAQKVSLCDVFMSGLAIRRCGQFPRYAETVRIPLVPRFSVQTLLRSTAFRGVI